MKYGQKPIYEDNKHSFLLFRCSFRYYQYLLSQRQCWKVNWNLLGRCCPLPWRCSRNVWRWHSKLWVEWQGGDQAWIYRKPRLRMKIIRPSSHRHCWLMRLCAVWNGWIPCSAGVWMLGSWAECSRTPWKSLRRCLKNEKSSENLCHEHCFLFLGFILRTLWTTLLKF